MDLTPFKLDIDELINDFTESNSTTLDDMKKIWLSRKFSYIYEAKPTANLGFFMQSLYAYSIGHMVSEDSLSRRLGGLYCLYCLYETQPFKPPFKIYLSLGELKKLKCLAVDVKERIKVVPALVKRMLEKNMFLFGFVDINESSTIDRVNEINKRQDSWMQIAYEKLFANTRIDHFLPMDLAMELDLKVLNKMSTEYAKAKELAINEEAGKLVDIQNIKHIVENNKLIGDDVDKIANDWNIQKEMFYQQTGLNHHQKVQEENDDADFDQELAEFLYQ